MTATAWASAFCTTARADYGESFAERLIELRAYLIAHHPFTQRLLRIAELPGPRIKVDSMIRIEAHSAPTGKMEIAEVSSCVPGARLSRRPGRPQAPASAGAPLRCQWTLPLTLECTCTAQRCHKNNSPPSFSAAAASPPAAHLRAVMHPSCAARPKRRDAH